MPNKFFLFILSFFAFASNAIAEEPPPSLMQQKIKHVVILMLDNGSFDSIRQSCSSLWSQVDWIDLSQNRCSCIDTCRSQDFPILFRLARHYAFSDQWFALAPIQERCHRNFSICGLSNGQIFESFPEQNFFQLPSNSLWSCLAEHSPTTSWAIFLHADTLPVLFPEPFNGIQSFPNLNRITDLQNHFQTMASFHELARKGQLPDISLLEPDWVLDLNREEGEGLNFIIPDRELIAGYQINDFEPIEEGFCATENTICNVYTSLSSNKEAWNETLLIILFDDPALLLDPLLPQSAISLSDQFQSNCRCSPFGVQVPAIFISPLIEKGTVVRPDDCKLPFNHASLIATILKWKNINKNDCDLGSAVERAPTFEKVITLTQPRADNIVGCDSLPCINSNVVHMGDLFCLRHINGNYLCSSVPDCLHIATIGPCKDKICLEFISGSGRLTHGSFCAMKSHGLLNTQTRFDCTCPINRCLSGQWWTIRSLENPFLGAEICFGDRIFIENHTRWDAFPFIPDRLNGIENIFRTNLRTQLCDECACGCWIIERP